MSQEKFTLSSTPVGKRRSALGRRPQCGGNWVNMVGQKVGRLTVIHRVPNPCLLYTSDAADE